MSRNPELHRFFHKKERAEDYLIQRIGDLKDRLRQQDPHELASRTGSEFTEFSNDGGYFRLTVWDQEVGIDFPEFFASYAESEEPVDTFSLALLAYYFHISDGTPESGEWIAFSELPDGKFYAQAFQGYTGVVLAKAFGNDQSALGMAAETLNGQPEALGDSAFSFRVLPRVSLMVVCWLGDEDFPPSYRILFDAAASHHLSTDGCAVVGSTLTRRLVKALDQR